MILDLSNPNDKLIYKQYVNKLFIDKAIVEINNVTPRSIKQNAYLHLILSYFASEYGCSIEEAKIDFFKRECNKELFIRTKNNTKGLNVQYLRSSSQLTTSEMKTAIDRFRNWSASVADIYLPGPEEYKNLVFIQKDIEKDKTYL